MNIKEARKEFIKAIKDDEYFEQVLFTLEKAQEEQEEDNEESDCPFKARSRRFAVLWGEE